MMPHIDLSFHAARLQSLHDYLANTDVLSRVDHVVNHETLFAFQLTRDYVSLFNTEVAPDESVRLNKLVSDISQLLLLDSQLSRITLLDMLQETLRLTMTSVSANREACINLLPLFVNSITMNIESGEIQFAIPSAAIAQLFQQLRHEWLSINEHQLSLNLNAYFNSKPQAIFLVDKGIGQFPTLLINSQKIPQNQPLLIETQQPNGNIQIKPYFTSLKPNTPPMYHFILDVSSSMKGDRIQQLKNSVKQFAQTLFNYQSNATLNIDFFNHKMQNIGQFTNNELEELNEEIDQLIAIGGTDIASASNKKIEEILTTNRQNNVLLFTDCEQNSDRPWSIALVQHLEKISPQESLRNKFFIISFNELPIYQEQLTAIVDAFQSSLIMYKSADLQAALMNAGRLQEWVAARDLFTTRILLTATNGHETLIESAMSANQVGQLVSLKSFEAAPGDTISFTIEDGTGKNILQWKKSLPDRASVMEIQTKSPSSRNKKMSSQQLVGEQASYGALPSKSIFGENTRHKRTQEEKASLWRVVR
jgi:hypothetical protein